MDIKINETEVDIVNSNVEISGLPYVAVSKPTADNVIITPENFVISSGNMYGSGNLVGQVPEWVRVAVQTELTTGDGNLTGVITDLQGQLDNLEVGVYQQISALTTSTVSQNSLLTSISSKVDNNHADVLSILDTKVTGTEASTIATNVINSTFGGNVNAYIGNIAATYTDENSAIAQNMDLIVTQLNGQSASVTEIASATVDQVLNPLWVDDGLGTDPDTNGNPKYILKAKAQKQINVDANGVVTSLILDSGETSAVTIQADEFKLVASGQSAASQNPFTVSATTGDISFNGKVTLTGLGIDSNTTTIDGGKITTNTLQADRLKAGTNSSTVWTNGGLISSNFNGNAYGNIGMPTAGFRLSSNAVGTSDDPNIYGAYIKGATIDSSSNITSSTLYIDNINVKSSILGNYCSPITSVANGESFIGYANGIGYSKYRIANNNSYIYVLCSARVGGYIPPQSTKTFTAYLYYNIGNGNVVMDTKSVTYTVYIGETITVTTTLVGIIQAGTVPPSGSISFSSSDTSAKIIATLYNI